MSKDLDTAAKHFGAALGRTAPGRAYMATSQWLLEPKPINRFALVGLFTIAAFYVGGSIVLTIGNL